MRVAWWGALIVAMAASAAATQPLNFDPKIPDKKLAKNISGAACTLGPEHKYRRCLLVGDERSDALVFHLTRNKLIVDGKPFQLLQGEAELDAEGVAADGTTYWVVGSHGLSQSGMLEDTRFQVLRIASDPNTGAPTGRAEASSRLRELLKTTAPFKHYAEKALTTEHGVNIEGVAVQNGQMYLAFRGPVATGQAHVLRVDKAALFDERVPWNAQAFALDLAGLAAPGSGLRDVAAVPGGGLLLLTGPESDVDGTAAILLWDGEGGPPSRLWTDPRPKSGARPESLTVISADGALELLLMSDGVPGGDPQVIRLSVRPGHND